MIDIEEMKDRAFKAAVEELRQEYAKDQEFLKKLQAYDKKEEKEEKVSKINAS